MPRAVMCTDPDLSATAKIKIFYVQPPVSPTRPPPTAPPPTVTPPPPSPTPPTPTSPPPTVLPPTGGPPPSTPVPSRVGRAIAWSRRHAGTVLALGVLVIGLGAIALAVRRGSEEVVKRV